ncbi:MAG TPA: SNF2-related protein, partial [Chitinophagaceae bacterium]|nr:SNF2-related protein [Chitinophagaceae bacterium]
MALPYLIKYIYNNGTDEVIRRGKKIHATGSVELVEYDDLLGSVTFRVKDDSYNTYYKVYITKFKDPKTLSLRCGCPYNLGDICRHESAALFQLQEMMDKHQLTGRELSYNQQHTVVKMKQLELKIIRMLTAAASFSEAEDFLRASLPTIAEARDERVLADVEHYGSHYKVVIQKNEERNFDTSCNCDSDHEHPLCVHKAIVLLHLLNKFGPNYFDSIRNWDKEKDKLLSLYGYSLEDNLDGKFEFTYKDGKPFLRVLDPTIKRVATPAAPAAVKPKPAFEQPAVVAEEEIVPKSQLKLGLVISYNPHQYPYVQLDAVQGEANSDETSFAGKVERLDLARFINTDVFNDPDKLLVQQMRKLLPGEVSRYLNRNSPFSGIWENIIQQHDDELPEETRHLIIEYLHSKYKKIFTDVAESHFTFYLPPRKTFITSSLVPANFSINFLTPEFLVEHKGNTYEVSCTIRTPMGEKSIGENQLASSLLFQCDDQFYIWQKQEDIALVEKFMPGGKITIDKEDWNTQLQQFILPLSKDYNVQFSNVQKEEVRDVKPEIRMMLKEKGDYLLFQPSFVYMGYDVKPSDKEKIVLPVADRLLVIHRNITVEQAFIQKIESLHSGFIHPLESDTLALKGSDVLKNNWFFLFIDALKEMNIPVFGFDALKNFRFNTAKPSTKIYISSHTDWFDAKIDIQFGEQKITVADVKKALANKQQYVQLQDGTLGILPEEWIKKYSLLFRVGDGKNNNMKLSKYHFSVIEELYEKRDEEELVFKLEEKYDNLRYNHQIENIPPPAHLSEVLRPYQASGFHWLNYLSEVCWGGILADDMGLGKTIQALSFMHYLKEKNGALRALVVCPTTLMYNWENEIKKFTPALTYYIHHGGARTKETLGTDVDVTITTYGTLRSDIRQFVEVQFDYVVLDESQAIKNPASKVAKAATLLKAKNRLCLS